MAEAPTERIPLPWVVYDPEDGADFFATEEEAVAAATALIDGYLDDNTWNEDVESIFVAKVTHGAARANLVTKDDPEWDARTGGNASSHCAEWFDIEIEPMEAVCYRVASTPPPFEGTAP